MPVVVISGLLGAGWFSRTCAARACQPVIKFDTAVECARDGGQLASWELTGAAGLSEDESHGHAPHP